MNDSSSARDELLHVISNKLLPWATNDLTPVILFQPPFRVPESIEVTPVESPLLDNRNRAQFGVTRWRTAAMNASSYPGICCVLDGEVERSVGVTQRMVQGNAELDVRHGRYIVRLPHQTFHVTPPGVPFDDGSDPHWFSDRRDIPDSLILWINCTPQGVEMHLCRTQNGDHAIFYPAYVRDPHALTIAELLIDDLRSVSFPLPVSTRHYLVVLLLRIEQALKEKQGLFTTVGAKPVHSHKSEQNPYTAEVVAIERACRFIDSYLATPLTVQRIADHLYISPTQVNRLFRRELGVSPMTYVNTSRMKVARSLLLETNYPIQYISNFFGYSHPDVFSRAFKQHFGVSPVQFRKQQQR